MPLSFPTSFALPRAAKIAAAALALALAAPQLAAAGPQYVDQSGFAVSGHDVVAYFDMADQQSAIGAPQPEAVAGKREFTTEYNGATWAFSSAENLARFEENPEAFAPQYDGHCAYGVSKGGKVPGNPDLWRIVDGKLYLNITPNVVGFWEEDIPGNITLAEGNWPGIEGSASVSRNAPGFDSSQAPL